LDFTFIRSSDGFQVICKNIGQVVFTPKSPGFVWWWPIVPLTMGGDGVPTTHVSEGPPERRIDDTNFLRERRIRGKWW
jgi:hypothetical protein